MGYTGRISEWIYDERFGFANPASIVGVLPVVDRRPTDTGWLQAVVGLTYRIGDLDRQNPLHIRYQLAFPNNPWQRAQCAYGLLRW